jgi:hypothetical protein
LGGSYAGYRYGVYRSRNDTAIASEASLDGVYVLNTSVSQAELDADATVRSCKALATVERAFRSCKTIDLEAIRPNDFTVIMIPPMRFRAAVPRCSRRRTADGAGRCR